MVGGLELVSRDGLTIGQSVHLHRGPEPVGALGGTNLRKIHEEIAKKIAAKRRKNIARVRGVHVA